MFDFRKNDPEFAERFEHFALEEVVNEPGQQLDPVTRHLAILATLLGCQGIDAFREELPAALDAGVTPVMAKEVVYQGVDYLGIGRVSPFCRLPMKSSRSGASPFPWKAKPLQPWKIVWRKAPKHRRKSLVTICWRRGSKGISIAGWPPTASGTTTPAQVWT